ncbi:MAG: PTS lactose transporter subunit IIC [Geminicoccaceae bacterium]|nr:MAG: PTS lactose transporter subunit IIC [Geminicoccaceae bacterium]
MPEIAQVLSPGDVRLRVEATSKRHLISEIAATSARTFGLDQAAVVTALTERERLGSTGVGHGVALPHARLPGVSRLLGLFWHLATPIEFDAIDDEPVDLVFVLLVPDDAETMHLKTLAKIARRLRDRELRNRLRQFEDPKAAWRALVGDPSVEAAA